MKRNETWNSRYSRDSTFTISSFEFKKLEKNKKSSVENSVLMNISIGLKLGLLEL